MNPDERTGEVMIDRAARDLEVIKLQRMLLKVLGHTWYYSTSCLHDQHEHCRSAVSIDGEGKNPGTCKWCPAKCICPCH